MYKVLHVKYQDKYKINIYEEIQFKMIETYNFSIKNFKNITTLYFFPKF